MKTPDEGALRASLALLAAAAVISTGWQMAPGTAAPLSLISQARADEGPAAAVAAPAQPAAWATPDAQAPAGTASPGPAAAARWYAWRMLFDGHALAVPDAGATAAARPGPDERGAQP